MSEELKSTRLGESLIEWSQARALEKEKYAKAFSSLAEEFQRTKEGASREMGKFLQALMWHGSDAADYFLADDIIKELADEFGSMDEAGQHLEDAKDWFDRRQADRCGLELMPRAAGLTIEAVRSGILELPGTLWATITAIPEELADAAQKRQFWLNILVPELEKVLHVDAGDPFEVWESARKHQHICELLATLAGRDPETALPNEVGPERPGTFTTHELLVLEIICRERPVPDKLRPTLLALAGEGIVEAIGRGRGARYMLTRRYYAATGHMGVYTRKRGLDRDTNKALLLKHLTDNAGRGSPIAELEQVLPSQHRRQVQRLLGELRDEGQVYSEGRARLTQWHAGPSPTPSA